MSGILFQSRLQLTTHTLEMFSIMNQCRKPFLKAVHGASYLCEFYFRLRERQASRNSDRPRYCGEQAFLPYPKFQGSSLLLPIANLLTHSFTSPPNSIAPS